jgi:GR25 family glycosyltransferase involved in LPS biosynthesis
MVGEYSIVDDYDTVLSKNLLPKELGPILTISIRRGRFDGFLNRMGAWSQHVKRVKCCDGRGIDIQQWIRTKKINRHSLSKGQLGCYESHVRAWQAIANGPHEIVSVFEDDVDISWTRGSYMLKRMYAALKELKEKNIEWDFLSWGYGPQAIGKNIPINQLRHWKKPNICQGFFMYTMKRSLAQKLLTKCFPYTAAVDMFFYWDFIKKNNVNVLCLEPRLCFVIDGPSETTKLLP